MSHIAINILAVAVMLGIIVFVHELGHFLAAKFFGVRVEVFSLGFGTRLAGFRRGDTDYRISALPLGGYVKMAGVSAVELPTSSATDDPRNFNAKPRWQRFIIAIGGPAMNVFLAVGLLVAVYMHSFPRESYLDQPAVVAEVDPGSPAAKSGIQPGDRIIRFDGVENPTWEQVGTHAAMSVDHSIPVAVLRNRQIVQMAITPLSNPKGTELIVGVVPKEPVIVRGFTPGVSAARQAGLRVGDQIVGADGKRVLNPGDLVGALQSAPGQRQDILVKRGARTIPLTVQPQFASPDGGPKRWVIGVDLSPPMVPLPFSKALAESLAENKTYSLVIFQLLGRLLEHRAALSSLQGPVGIASAAGEAARQSSVFPFVRMTSLISLNLAIMNLLPIPILDGGLILFLFIESLMRRDVSPRVKEIVYQAGFAFLILLMSFVFYNDIARSLRH
jgi:regulator of sigma E protease